MRSSVRPRCAAFQKPRADMVISGSGPNLSTELQALSVPLVSPFQIYSIIAPIQVIDFSHPPGTDAGCLRHGDVAQISFEHDAPFPAFLQRTALISALPRAEKRFMMAMRIWISAVWQSGSRDMILSPKSFRQFITASTRLRT